MIGAVVAVALSYAAPQADAQCCGYARPTAWGCCYAPRYVSPCYSCYSPCSATVGYCGTSYCESDWYLGARPGPVRRLLFGSCRWYRAGCGWGYGYGCGSSCGCGYDLGYSPCCGDTGSLPVQGNVPPPGPTPTPARKPVIEPPATPVPDEPKTMPAPTPPKTSATSAENSGVLTVWVPYDAKVTVNGQVTKSTGSRRQFVSYGLKPGLSYKYVIKAEVVRDGKIVEETPQTVNLTAGQITAVAFGFNVTQTEQVAASK